MEQKLAYIKNKFEKNNIALSDRQAKQFLQYYEYLVEKNKVMNLTAITEFEEVILKHFIDSISLINCKKISSGETLIDVGTGAGFPGIPLKIMNPELKVTLLDSLNKRINFLNEVIQKLGLEDITAIHARAEDGAKNKALREQFDYCVSRAVANLSSLSEYCLPFVKKGGLFISYKAGNVEEELAQAKKAIFLLGGKVEKVEKFQLPESDISRTFIMIKKEKPTPAKYPRKAGLPSKEPIS